MNSNNSIACPLDCFDTCEASYNDGKIKASASHVPTNKKLCVNFAKLLKEETFSSAFYDKNAISLKSALNILVEKLKSTKASKTLYYKGSGNLGVLQSYPKTFFAKYGSVFTQGGLCDNIGSHALETSRGGANINPPLDYLINADVIICWGRNFTVTSSHMYKLVKDKIFITIDPMTTPIAKKSELHLQIKPKTDHELALLLTQMIYLNNIEDKEFINEHEGHKFYELACKRSIDSYIKTLDLKIEDIHSFINLIKGKKIALMLGLGAQKYYEGASIFRSIDSFAASMGLHNTSRSAGGVWYLADGSYGYEKQLIANPKKRVDISCIDYSAYDLVFIQAGNVLVSNPNTFKIKEALKNTFVVFFGTSKNESSEYANLIIPASTFLEKKDVRLSYGHEYKSVSYVHEYNNEKISEYNLCKYLFDAFDYEGLKEEDDVFNYYKNAKAKSFEIKNYNFIKHFNIKNLYEIKKENEYFFITSKAKNSLNSQFAKDENVYLHPNNIYASAKRIKLLSLYGSAEFSVVLSPDIREDCVLCYSGNKYANYLTPSLSDEVAFSAILQEVLVRLELP
ncbi:MAG: molybdopterin-dependent oxidoreductase [Campylobacteraceae bacterium]|nr:molybdopterin-dependent oxidoreductase [Campylobacteraceae bacterium]